MYRLFSWFNLCWVQRVFSQEIIKRYFEQTWGNAKNKRIIILNFNVSKYYDSCKWTWIWLFKSYWWTNFCWIFIPAWSKHILYFIFILTNLLRDWNIETAFIIKTFTQFQSFICYKLTEFIWKIPAVMC